MIVFEQDLIQACSLIERAQGGFGAFDGLVTSSMVEALVVDSTQLEDSAEIACLGQEAVFVPEAVEIQLLGERPGFVPILRDIANPEHDAP
jgi:hypothetical protein